MELQKKRIGVLMTQQIAKIVRLTPLRYRRKAIGIYICSIFEFSSKVVKHHGLEIKVGEWEGHPVMFIAEGLRNINVYRDSIAGTIPLKIRNILFDWWCSFFI